MANCRIWSEISAYYLTEWLSLNLCSCCIDKLDYWYSAVGRLLQNSSLISVITITRVNFWVQYQFIVRADTDTWAQTSTSHINAMCYFPFISKATLSVKHRFALRRLTFRSPTLTELREIWIVSCSVARFSVLLHFLLLTMFIMEMQVQNLHSLLYSCAFCDIYCDLAQEDSYSIYCRCSCHRYILLRRCQARAEVSTCRASPELRAARTQQDPRVAPCAGRQAPPGGGITSQGSGGAAYTCRRTFVSAADRAGEFPFCHGRPAEDTWHGNSPGHHSLQGDLLFNWSPALCSIG